MIRHVYFISDRFKDRHQMDTIYLFRNNERWRAW